MSFRRLCIIATAILVMAQASAQTPNWMPIPMGQTSFYKNVTTHEIIPMKTDRSIGTDSFEIYGQFLHNEFDTCMRYVWYTPLNGRPNADYAALSFHDTVWVISDISNEYFLPTTNQVNDVSLFNEDYNLMIRLDSTSNSVILDQIDSMLHFSVYDSTLTELYGTISLSENFGLIDYTPIKKYATTEPKPDIMWELIGCQNDTSEAGFSLPVKEDYLPYSINDEIIFYHTYYSWSNGDFHWEQEYHHLTIDAVSKDVDAEIQGICQIYDQNGIFLSTDSNYVFEFDPMLQTAIDEPASVPFNPSSEYRAFAKTYWYQFPDGEDVMITSNISTETCDTNQIVDGNTITWRYSSEFGLVEKDDNGIMPPNRFELFYAKIGQKEYGEWPTWLSTEHVTKPGGFKVYPNPASSAINIVLPRNFEAGQLTVLSSSGQIVLSKTASPANQVDVTDLTNGLYHVRFESREGTFTSKLMILK